MKQSEAKEFWPLIKAWSEGATLEYRDGDDGWSEARDLEFSLSVECYRIKPEPKLRAWKHNNCPIGARFAGMHGCSEALPSLITSVELAGFRIAVPNGNELVRYEEALRNKCTFSHDGKTWAICGVEDSQ